VNAAAVALGSGHAVLKGSSRSRQARLHGDIEAFGALLYEMINGRKSGPDLPLPVVPCTVPRTGFDGLKMAANRLASRCLSDDSLDMQKVATEVRLLKILARGLPAHALEARPQPLELPASEPAAEAHSAAAEPAEIQARGTPEDSPLDAASSNCHCPRCGSAYVRVSKPRTGVESFLHRIGSPVRRCRRCYHRYFIVLGIHFSRSAPAETSGGVR
jgi:hypothetical protein